MSKEISFLLSIGWLNSWACCQPVSPFPPLSEAVSLKDLEPVRKEVVNGSCSGNHQQYNYFHKRNHNSVAQIIEQRVLQCKFQMKR